jgi:hypothetical protein
MAQTDPSSKIDSKVSLQSTITSMSLSLSEFFEKQRIPAHKIWYYWSEVKQTKVPIGEKNNKPLEEVLASKNINPQKPPVRYIKSKDPKKYDKLPLQKAKRNH